TSSLTRYLRRTVTARLVTAGPVVPPLNAHRGKPPPPARPVPDTGQGATEVPGRGPGATAFHSSVGRTARENPGGHAPPSGRPDPGARGRGSADAPGRGSSRRWLPGSSRRWLPGTGSRGARSQALQQDVQQPGRGRGLLGGVRQGRGGRGDHQ